MDVIAQSLTDSQQAVLDALLGSEAHTFVCGQAGTGKSFVLAEFVAKAPQKVVVCAPTGLAATHVEGVTIHSLFHLPIDTDFLEYSPYPHDETDKVLAKVDTVVIDEASMVRADMLDAIDLRLRLARESNEPFGGARMVLFGDLLQLPPVLAGRDRERLSAKYQSEFFFDADAAQATEFVTLELSEIVRQQEPAFARVLQGARVGGAGTEGLRLLNSRVVERASELPKPILATRNDVVKRHNDEGLAALPGEAQKYTREWRGRDGAKAPKDAPCDWQLELKVGCPVLFMRNDPELGVSNGTAGVVTALDPDTVTVETKHGELEVEQIKWPVKEYAFDAEADAVRLTEIGEFLQLPLRLGFAMTIHRAQGQTYDAATVDFAAGNPFTPGHAYVAVSRVRTLAGLTLTRPLRAGDFRCSQRAREFLVATLAR